MSMNLGMNLVEVDGRAAPSIQGAATSVAGFVIRPQRNGTGVVCQVTNFAEFVERFGSYMNGAYGAYAVKGFFDNGGTMAYVVGINGSGGTAASATFKNSATTPADVLKVHAGYLGQLDVGKWGEELQINIASGNKGTFILTVMLRDRIVETWEGLKMGGTGDEDPLRVNNAATGSKYIKVEVIGNATTNPAPTLNPTTGNPTYVPLANSTDPADPGATAYAGAFAKFDAYDIQLMACPESSDATVVNAALAKCAERGDCMFVGHVPNGDADAAKTYVSTNSLQGAKVYGALYFPFILVANPLDTSGQGKWIPPTGHVMGVYARTDRERGVWKAPAGNAAKVHGALNVQHHITDAKHTDLVKKGSVNAIRAIAGQGIVIDSSRTLSTDTRWLYVNVRLLFNFVKSSLKNGLRWVVQEPNDSALWNKVKYNTVTPFLMGLWRRGAFGPGAPNEVFTVKVDAENNPPASIQQGNLNIEVYFYPSRPAETIVLVVGQQEGGAKASD
jgi:uncharacterized protein